MFVLEKFLMTNTSNVNSQSMAGSTRKVKCKVTQSANITHYKKASSGNVHVKQVPTFNWCVIFQDYLRVNDTMTRLSQVNQYNCEQWQNVTHACKLLHFEATGAITQMDRVCDEQWVAMVVKNLYYIYITYIYYTILWYDINMWYEMMVRQAESKLSVSPVLQTITPHLYNSQHLTPLWQQAFTFMRPNRQAQN